jgi:hypothetical protein
VQVYENFWDVIFEGNARLERAVCLLHLMTNVVTLDCKRVMWHFWGVLNTEHNFTGWTSSYFCRKESNSALKCRLGGGAAHTAVNSQDCYRYLTIRPVIRPFTSSKVHIDDSFTLIAILFQHHEHQYPIRGHGKICHSGTLNCALNFSDTPHHSDSEDYKWTPLVVYH